MLSERVTQIQAVVGENGGPMPINRGDMQGSHFARFAVGEWWCVGFNSSVGRGSFPQLRF